MDDLSLTENDFKGPWPKWSKRAGARLLRIYFPGIPTSRWMKCFEANSIEEIYNLLDDGRFIGRMARVYTELRTNDPQTFELFNKHEWIKSILDNDGNFKIETGKGIFNQILHRMAEVFERSPDNQVKFWRSFSKGFEKKLKFRRQDKKAIRIYLFLIMIWPKIDHFASMRELYNFVFKHIPPELCPEDMDPIDFEDRQFKWFETLCRRNLGLTFRNRKRRAGE